MRRIEVFMGLLFIQNKKKNQYFINIMTCIFLSDGQNKRETTSQFIQCSHFFKMATVHPGSCEECRT